MLELLKGATEETFGVIERELRCGSWTWNLRTDEMQWSRGYYDLLGIEPGKVTPSFSAILQVTFVGVAMLRGSIARSSFSSIRRAPRRRQLEYVPTLQREKISSGCSRWPMSAIGPC